MTLYRSALVLAFLLVSVSTAAQTPVLNVNPVLVDFGTLDVGSSETQTITLSNLTAAPLPITGFNAGGDASFSIDVHGGSDPCGSENPTLDPSGFCTMTVTYAPLAAGSGDASVSFTPNNQPSLSVNARFLGEALAPDSGGCALGAGSTGVSGPLLLFLPLLVAWIRRFWP